MPEFKETLKVKVQAKLTERDKDTGKVLREIKIKPNMIDDKKMISEFMKQRGGGKKHGINK